MTNPQDLDYSRVGSESYTPPYIQFIDQVQAMYECTRKINPLTGRLMHPNAANSICQRHADRIKEYIVGPELKMSSLVREKVKIYRGYNITPHLTAFSEKETLEIYHSN